MALIYVCNRCGKIIHDIEDDIFVNHLVLGKRSSITGLWKGENRDVEIDLCDDCIEKFQDWIGGKSE